MLPNVPVPETFVVVAAMLPNVPVPETFVVVAAMVPDAVRVVNDPVPGVIFPSAAI